MERKPACSSGANPDARGGERAGRTEYMEKDLTSGSVLKNIFTFSLPYLLSYFLQTLYGMADLFIIGRFEGVASTTAVSIGSQVMHMITVILVGVAMGTTVCIGRSVGAGDKKQAAKVIGNTVTLFMVGSVVLAAALGPRGPYRPAHLHPGGGRGRYGGLPHHLLHRHPLHHSL